MYSAQKGQIKQFGKTDSKISEKERNKRLMLLIQKLREENDLESIQLIETMVQNDTEAIKKSFLIMTETMSK